MPANDSDRDVQQKLRLSALKCALGIAGDGVLEEGRRVREMFEPTQERYFELAEALGYDNDNIDSWAKSRAKLTALLEAIENDEVLAQSYPTEGPKFDYEQYVLGYRFIIETPTDDQKGDGGDYYAVSIAKRLTEQLVNNEYLDQDDARDIVINEYGPAYTYTNHSGGRGINKVVLEHFKQIRPASSWDGSGLAWSLN